MRINREKALRGVILLGVVLLLCGATAVLARVTAGAVPAAAEQDDCQVRSRLLMEAMDSVGVADPLQAVDVWASGLIRRSGALQYAVMTPALRKEYEPQLTKNFPNWVTGVSSPWVSGYRILDTRSPNQRTFVATLRLSTLTSAGPAGDYDAVLTLVRQGDFWRIAAVDADPALSVYTGFDAPGS